MMMAFKLNGSISYGIFCHYSSRDLEHTAHCKKSSLAADDVAAGSLCEKEAPHCDRVLNRDKQGISLRTK